MADETPEQRLAALGLTLPPVPKPMGSYVPWRREGDMLWTSGQGPRRPDGVPVRGKVPTEMSVEDAYGYARMVGLGLLAALALLVGRGLPANYVSPTGREDIRAVTGAEAPYAYIAPIEAGKLLGRTTPSKTGGTRSEAGVSPSWPHSTFTPVIAGANTRANWRITLASMRSPGLMNSAAPRLARARPFTR
jgi:hypothetical protein